jgi:hypothetical protein
MSRRIRKTPDEPVPAEAAPVADTSAPVADEPAKKARNSLKPIITLEDRFARGNFRIKEAAALCGCSVSSINKYIKLGHLAHAKCGGCTCIPGPSLASFMRGE